MICRCLPPQLLARVAACFLLALLARPALRAEDAAVPPGTAPAAAETAGAEAAPVVAPDKSRDEVDDGRLASEEIGGLLNLGARLTDRDDFAAAEIAFRHVLKATDVPADDTKTALLGLARMHRHKGEFTKAAAIYERYLQDYPGDRRTPDALLELGRTLRDLGVYRMAISRFYSVMNSTLKLPAEGFDHYQVLAKTAQFEIAETHFLAGEFAEAAKFYSRLRLLDLAPVDRARAHFKSAHALRLQGDLEGAVRTLRAYIDQWPDDENIPEARYMLAVTLRELKRPQEAFVATLDLLRSEKARVSADPKRWAYWQRRTGNQLANDFFESGDTLNAHAIYTGLLELADEPTWRLPVMYQLALCYERLGIVDRARSQYQTIISESGATPPVELAELVRMAAWRLEHIDWHNRVSDQITKMFESTTGTKHTAASTADTSQAAATP